MPIDFTPVPALYMCLKEQWLLPCTGVSMTKPRAPACLGYTNAWGNKAERLGEARQTPWGGEEKFSASSKTDTATLGDKGQNKRALPTLAMNTGFRYISG